MKRIMVLLLSLLLLLTVFACKRTDQNEGNADDGKQETVEANAPTATEAQDPDSFDETYGYVEEGASVRYIDEDFPSYTSQTMVCMDEDDKVVSVKQKLLPKNGKTTLDALAAWTRPVEGDYHEEDVVAYFLWSQAAVDEQFAGMFPEEVQAALDSWEGKETTTAQAKEASLNQIVYDENGLMVNVDTLRYQMGKLIEFDVTYTNTGKRPVNIFIDELFINGWKVPTGQDNYIYVGVSSREKYTYAVTNADSIVYSLMGMEDISSFKYSFGIYDESYQLLKTETTMEATNTECDLDFTQEYDDSGKVLLSDETIRLVLKRFDEKTGRSIIYLEKPESSKWTTMALDATYNNYGTLATEYYKLEKGMHAMIEMNAEEVCTFYGIEEVNVADLYLTYYHSASLKDPIHVKLYDDGTDVAPKSKNQIVYDSDICQLRFVGWRDDVFVDTDVIVLECYNKTIDKNLSVYLSYDYIMLDAGRTKAGVHGANCYPESMSRLLITPQESQYSHLGNFDTAQFTLTIYEIRNGYHSGIGKTEIIKVNLN